MRFALLAVLLLPALALAQGVPIKSGASSDVASVNTNKALLVSLAPGTRATYIATVAGATTTAAYNLEVEAPAGTGFKVSRICVSYALGATAAGTIITTTVRRNTAAGSGGTTCTAEGTGVTAISKLDPAAGSFAGACRGLASTLGTSGATIDQWQFPQTVVAATTGITQPAVICRDYGLQSGDQSIIVAAGTSNGVSVNVSAGGAGSLAVGAISMWIIAE